MKRVAAVAALLCLLVGLACASISVEEWKDGLLAQEPHTEEEARVTCPNNCGARQGQGQCGSDGRCICRETWGGEDCSIRVRILGTTHTIASSVEAGTWEFFVTDTRPGQTVTWSVNSTTGDCDLYVKSGEIPTRQRWDNRDVGVAMNFQVQVVNGNSAHWYAGIHGFQRCNYTIGVSLFGSGDGSQCPNSCGNHGQCVRGQCQCQGNWGGADCSTPLIQLNPNYVMTGAVHQREWKYYVFSHAQDMHHLTVELNQTSTYGDADLFVKFGHLPNQTSFDYRDVGVDKRTRIDVYPPSGSTFMYVGVYGAYATSYNVSVMVMTWCSSQCSRHGRCLSGNSCSCSPNFYGVNCEIMRTALSDGQPVDGFVADGVWNYYYLYTTRLEPVTIEVDQTDSDPNADCDLYVRTEQMPTQTQYNYADLSFARQMSITIPQPQFRNWWIGVYGKRKCAYRVRQSAASSCIPGCVLPYGTCTPENTCACQFGWAGTNCHTPVLPLQVGQIAKGALPTNQFAYYVFNVTTSLASVSLLEVESWARGYYWLYVGIDSVPDRTTFDYASTESNTPFHQIDVSFDADSVPTTLYVGVYGSPFGLSGPNQAVAHYQLSAWQSPF